jgi:prepilin-type N-terminal cleavage/methylation domain-containing protein
MKPMANRKRRYSHTGRRPRSAFSLVELLVVIALTSILLTLVFKPLLDSSNLTSRAGTQIETQQAARDVMRETTNILGNAVFVYDNLQTPIHLWFTDRGGTPYAQAVRFAMVEYVKPARQLDQQPGTTPIDPTSGDPIYPDSLPPGARGFAFPLAPGRALGRLFVGLIDNVSVNGIPTRPYANRFENPALSNVDNRYTLYKAEVLAYIPDRNNPSRYVPNLGLFHTRNANGQRTDNISDPIDLHDPNFFYDSSLAGGDGSQNWAVPGWRDLNGDNLVQIFENWRAVSTSLLPLSKVDMVALDREERSRDVLYYKGNPPALSSDADARPQVRLMVRFEPSFVENDPGLPGQLGNTGNEAPNAAAPVYTGRNTHWATPYRVMVYRNPAVGIFDNPDRDPLSLDPSTLYMATGEDPTRPGKIVRVQMPRNGTLPDFAGLPDIGPNPDPVTGMWRNADGSLRNPAFMADLSNPGFAFTVDPRRGTINFAFPAAVLIGYTATQQPIPALYDPVQINSGMLTPVGRRFLDLRTLPLTDSNNQALNAPTAISPLALLGANRNLDLVPLVAIVPGSERVYGPDQRPGPNYGRRVQYTRVSASAGFVGKNEYRINYVDAPNAIGLDRSVANASADPRVRIGYIEFDSLPESSDERPNLPPPDLPNNPPLPREDPAGVFSGGVPTFRRHGLPTLQNINGENQPAARVEVYYDFQMNRPNDVVKMDYMTRELMQITLEARLYDPRSSRAQWTSLNGSVKVRNLQR